MPQHKITFQMVTFCNSFSMTYKVNFRTRYFIPSNCCSMYDFSQVDCTPYNFMSNMHFPVFVMYRFERVLQSALPNSTKTYAKIFGRIKQGVKFRVPFIMGSQCSLSRENGRIKWVGWIKRCWLYSPIEFSYFLCYYIHCALEAFILIQIPHLKS